MIKKLCNKWLKKITKNFTTIPLFNITFNYRKYLKYGAKGSCDCHFHPDFKDDEKVKQMIFDVVDYIRENYDVKKFTEI